MAPGIISAEKIDEGEVGDRDVLSYENNSTFQIVPPAILRDRGYSTVLKGREGQEVVEKLRQLPMYEPPPSERGGAYKLEGIFYLRYQGEVYRVEFSIDRCIDNPYTCTDAIIFEIFLISFLGFATVALYLLYTRLRRNPEESG